MSPPFPDPCCRPPCPGPPRRRTTALASLRVCSPSTPPAIPPSSAGQDENEVPVASSHESQWLLVPDGANPIFRRCTRSRADWLSSPLQQCASGSLTSDPVDTFGKMASGALAFVPVSCATPTPHNSCFSQSSPGKLYLIPQEPIYMSPPPGSLC